MLQSTAKGPHSPTEVYSMLVFNHATGQVTEQDARVPGDNENVWLHMTAPEAKQVEHVLKHQFHCHPLVVEDCIKLNQRPKMDRYKDHVFITFFAVVDKQLTTAEIAIVVGRNFVITICKEPLPFFDELQKHFLQVEGSMEHCGRILYLLLDRCVDDYTDIINQIEDRVDRLEQMIYRNPYVHVSREIFKSKRKMHRLRRIIAEEKTMLGTITHQSFPYIRQEADVYFIDIYDHISRVVDSLDVFRESLTGLLELQMSIKSDRMNEIMKTLTIISSIFLPLTFIVGLYGMNFKNIPELSWNFGYAYVWIVMIVVTISLWAIFKWKRWI
ncbi:magnesium/cobalt transporter CorA [Paenibacillus elgii]|nr:magnesium/cobalt transporter CorA [Paenibacillus elgii]